MAAKPIIINNPQASPRKPLKRPHTTEARSHGEKQKMGLWEKRCDVFGPAAERMGAAIRDHGDNGGPGISHLLEDYGEFAKPWSVFSVLSAASVNAA
jgi:hypothetical protein